MGSSRGGIDRQGDDMDPEFPGACAYGSIPGTPQPTRRDAGRQGVVQRTQGKGGWGGKVEDVEGGVEGIATLGNESVVFLSRLYDDDFWNSLGVEGGVGSGGCGGWSGGRGGGFRVGS